MTHWSWDTLSNSFGYLKKNLLKLVRGIWWFAVTDCGCSRETTGSPWMKCDNVATLNVARLLLTYTDALKFPQRFPEEVNVGMQMSQCQSNRIGSCQLPAKQFSQYETQSQMHVVLISGWENSNINVSFVPSLASFWSVWLFRATGKSLSPFRKRLFENISTQNSSEWLNLQKRMK